MSNRIAAQFAVVVALALGAQQVPPRSGHDLFQQALVKERAEGKLEEAIQLYQRVIQDFASDRTLAAKAWLQTGRCYQKLGKPEARKIYERTLRDYADQREVAKQARKALRGLHPPGARSPAKVDGIKGSRG